jgi:hypothetical protein
MVMKRALGTIAALASLALATSCSNAPGDGESANTVPVPHDMPLCSEQFQQGKTIEEPSFGQACRSETDELVVPRPVRLSCADDTTLVWNNFAWGYVGQPMALFNASATTRVPTEQALACRENTGTTLPQS